MLLGDFEPLFLLEVAVRTGLMFLWLLLLLRLTGKRGLAQLSPLELAIVIGLGSAAGDPMFYAEVPLLHGMLVLAIVVGFQRLLAWLIIHSEAVETFVEGVPVELVRDGVMQLRGLERANISREDLFERLRPAGVRQLGQVQRAYFEQDGNISVFCREERGAPAGLPVVPPWDLEPPTPLPQDHEGLAACLICGRVQELGEGQPRTCGCGAALWTRAVTDPLADEPAGA
ncbi:Uncharacterized membrane protein YcaP, DUF421 family [Deinococcus reticulitermitis]|uniref:Uncharacterized membrane protein YcaP, DUF421 family n=2 Tax=Deinococcus reticulitermitis TaxID=856736 RepID=A0A1H6YX78_9DEIO|nr:Uncharacterized membrane protein YcaP, DUF421 family [Deinococcus reticulitermitis]